MARRKRDAGATRASAGRTRKTSHFERPLWIALILVTLSLFVYSPVRRFAFVNWDDPTYITENADVQRGLSWVSVRWALTTGHAPYWHPMTWLSHLLDVRLYGMDAGGHHVTSVLIHVANTLLLFALLRRMTGASGRSAFVAAVFAVHPLHVESVAWVTERKDVLSTLFWLLTVWAYVEYVRRPQWRRYVWVIGLYALALMSKPMVVTLPFVLLLLDIWPLRRVALSARERGIWTRLVAEKTPLIALAIGASIATFAIQQRVGALPSLGMLSWHTRAANALVAYIAYVGKVIWPVDLAAFYPQRNASQAIVFAAAVALVAASAAAVRYRDRYPYLFVGWLWYVVTLAPVIGLVQAGEQGMADRFMYVPMIGLLIIVTWGIPERLGQWSAARRVLPSAAVVIVIACAATARAQVEHWSDSVALWRHAARVTDDNYLAYENLGQALRDRGELQEAEASYERALALAPAGSPAYAAVIHNSLGMVFTRQGKPSAAAAQFALAVRYNPEFAEAQNNLGNALAGDGRFAEAIDHYRRAVRLKPDFTEAQIGLGASLVSDGKPAEAIAHYVEALRLARDSPQAHNGLGAALALEGHDEEAMRHYDEALRLQPDLVTAHFNVALLLAKRGKTLEARRHLETVLTIDPGYEPARKALEVLRH